MSEELLYDPVLDFDVVTVELCPRCREAVSGALFSILGWTYWKCDKCKCKFKTRTRLVSE